MNTDKNIQFMNKIIEYYKNKGLKLRIKPFKSEYQNIDYEFVLETANYLFFICLESYNSSIEKIYIEIGKLNIDGIEIENNIRIPNSVRIIRYSCEVKEFDYDVNKFIKYIDNMLLDLENTLKDLKMFLI